MSEAMTLTGKVVFNHVTKPDNFKGTERYALTVALDKAGKKLAEKAGLKTSEYEGNIQVTSRRKVEFDLPKIYNKDKEEVGVGHLSLFGDQVSMRVKQGKGEFSGYTYLEAIRVDEKAEGVADYDESEF
jgi:hypothetical protein|tara:strand:+ start:400 stop:786 length:387 start_codon:yes stop_codon:yes gene_type:complete